MPPWPPAARSTRASAMSSSTASATSAVPAGAVGRGRASTASSCPLATAIDGRRECSASRSGRKVSQDHCSSGCTSRSAGRAGDLPRVGRDEAELRLAQQPDGPARARPGRAARRRRGRRARCCRGSASSASRAQAHGLPSQPGGGSVSRRTSRTRGSSAATARHHVGGAVGRRVVEDEDLQVGHVPAGEQRPQRRADARAPRSRAGSSTLTCSGTVAAGGGTRSSARVERAVRGEPERGGPEHAQRARIAGRLTGAARASPAARRSDAQQQRHRYAHRDAPGERDRRPAEEDQVGQQRRGVGPEVERRAAPVALRLEPRRQPARAAGAPAAPSDQTATSSQPAKLTSGMPVSVGPSPAAKRQCPASTICGSRNTSQVASASAATTMRPARPSRAAPADQQGRVGHHRPGQRDDQRHAEQPRAQRAGVGVVAERQPGGDADRLGDEADPGGDDEQHGRRSATPLRRQAAVSDAAANSSTVSTVSTSRASAVHQRVADLGEHRGAGERRAVRPAGARSRAAGAASAAAGRHRHVRQPAIGRLRATRRPPGVEVARRSPALPSLPTACTSIACRVVLPEQSALPFRSDEAGEGALPCPVAGPEAAGVPGLVGAAAGHQAAGRRVSAANRLVSAAASATCTTSSRSDARVRCRRRTARPRRRRAGSSAEQSP